MFAKEIYISLVISYLLLCLPCSRWKLLRATDRMIMYETTTTDIGRNSTSTMKVTKNVPWK